MALPSGTGDATSNEAGLAVHGTPVFEPHPEKPGVWRVKKENGEVVYTAESIARFHQLLASRDARTAALGTGITADPVALYYAKEKEYQDHPEKPRPAKGPHSQPLTIPPQYLAPEPVVEQDAPIVIPNLPKRPPRNADGKFVKQTE